MVSHTASCQHLQGVGLCRPVTRSLLHRRPVATRSLTQAVLSNARQPLLRRQLKQICKKLRTHADGCAPCCAAAVGEQIATTATDPSSVFKLCTSICVWQTRPVKQSGCAVAAVEQLVLQPVKKIEGHVKLPGSKSLSNRILLLAALSKGTTEVQNLLVSKPIMPCKPALVKTMSIDEVSCWMETLVDPGMLLTGQ